MDAANGNSLTHQLALYKANGAEANWNLITTWKQQTRIALNSQNFETLINNRPLLHTFLTCISKNVEDIKLMRVPIEFLMICQKYSLPKVQILDYTVDNKNYAGMAQLILTGIFPGVRCVTPPKRFCYYMMARWKYVRKLVIRNSRSLCFFGCPCTMGDCPVIEELVVPERYMLVNVFKIFGDLPKLTTLILRLVRLYEYMGDPCMKTFLIFNWAPSQSAIDRIRGVLLDRIVYENSYVCEMAGRLKNLRRLDLDRKSCSTETDLWRIVANSPSLKLVNISDVDIGPNFFALSRTPMCTTLDNRPTPLRIIYAHVGKNIELIHCHFKHPRLHLLQSCKQPKNRYGPIIKFELTTPAATS